MTCSEFVTLARQSAYDVEPAMTPSLLIAMMVHFHQCRPCRQIQEDAGITDADREFALRWLPHVAHALRTDPEVPTAAFFKREAC